MVTVLLAACGGGSSGGSSGGSGSSEGGGGGNAGIVESTVLTEPPTGVAPILFNDPGCSGGDDGDLDNDGLSDCDERQLHGTNPALADTDGDTLSDAAEVVVFDPLNSRVQFNPLVADIARIAIDLVSVPQIELDFTESSGNTRTVGTQHDQSTTEGISTNRGGESSRQLEVGHTASVSTTTTVGAEVNVSPAGLGGSVSVEASLSAGFEASRTSTRGSSVNWSSEQRSENSRTLSESDSVSNSSGVTFDGGTLRVSAQIRNFGRLAYDVENLFLSAVIFDPARPFQSIPLTNLSFANGNFPTTSIPNGSTSAPLVFTGDLSLSQARRLLNNSSNLVIEPSTFRLLDANDSSILLREESLAAQTATVMIDFGANSNRVESHRIAVNRGFEDRSIGATDAMTEILGLDIQEGVGEWVYGNESSPRATPSGLLSVEGVAQSSTQNRYWYGALNQNSGDTSGSRVTTILNVLDSDYNLNDIRLRAGDILSFVYVGDADRDAIPDRYEESFGTDPNNADTDGDTLPDAIEVYGYMSNLSGTGQCDTGTQIRVTSNPLLVDSDEDGIDDATERANCTNPNFLVIADAGTDQFVAINSPVTLNGAASGMFTSQPDYQWDLVSGSDVFVNGNPVRTLSGISPQFTAPDDVTTLVFDLSVMVDGGMSFDQVLVQIQEDPSTAVYVGGPENTQGNGTINSPFPTLAEALASLSSGEDLYVMTRAEGSPYNITNTVALPPGTSLYGGYDANWQRDVMSNRTPIVLTPGTDFQAVVLVDASNNNATVSGVALRSAASEDSSGLSLVALQVASGNQVNIRNNTLQTDDATGITGASTYGSHIANVSRLQFSGNQVLVGIAGRGADGLRGDSGDSGSRGSNASGASGGGGGSGGDNNNGGRGGTGGAGTFNTNISSGSGGVGPGGDGGRSGTGNLSGSSGSNGSQGAGGMGANDDAVSDIRFTPTLGGAGVVGTEGGGGGGGGGGRNGGTQRGGGGGGGGGGGDHGAGGTGAQGGGAAVGVWLLSVDAAELRDNAISSGNGGAGGDGGSGGSGGSGGGGGSGAAGAEFCLGFACDRGAAGGNGGSGGRGGAGGDGAGGAGGPSIGVYAGAGAGAPIVINNTVVTGMGGAGGNRGNAGHGGDSIAVFDAIPDDGLQPDVRTLQATLGAGGAAGSQTDGGTAARTGCSGNSNCR